MYRSRTISLGVKIQEKRRGRAAVIIYILRQAVPDPPDMGPWAPIVTSAMGSTVEGHRTAHNSAKSVLGLLAQGGPFFCAKFFSRAVGRETTGTPGGACFWMSAG
jgi:hypothetical protein